jgi:hypothetical protein
MMSMGVMRLALHAGNKLASSAERMAVTKAPR